MLQKPCHKVGPDEVHVWHMLADRVTASSVLNEIETMLTPDERSRMDALQRSQDRVLYLLSRGLLRTVLASYLDCAGGDVCFAADAHGKPILRPGEHCLPLQFNLTHSRGAIALAVSGGREVGIDVEERNRQVDFLALAERFFAPSEARHLRTLNNGQVPDAFFAIWTLKEAYVKAIGRGISFPLDAFSFDLDANRLLGFQPLADFVSRDWHFQQFDLGERHCGALAVQNAGGQLDIEMREWPEVFVAPH